MTQATARQRRGKGLRSHLNSEFGIVLEDMIRATPGALAAVLSDVDGDAIDFAHDPAEIEAIDVQLLAAQTGQTVVSLDATYQRHRILHGALLLEAEKRCLVAALIASHYVLALLLDRRANVGRGLLRFEIGRAALAPLL